MEAGGASPSCISGDDELGTGTSMTRELAAPFQLGPMPRGCSMEEVDSQYVHAPVHLMFELASKVEKWPSYLTHYRYVKFREKRSDGGGVVEMSANRPFAIKARWLRASINWPTWWLSEMAIDEAKPSIRFRHIGGITKGMEVEWTFIPAPDGTHVRIVHLWDGPNLPEIGPFAATYVIGPVFVHGIASRTLAGLATVAEKKARNQQ
jgi:ribosome-associated toxin RatA of RatAB toxin-antitoxin module